MTGADPREEIAWLKARLRRAEEMLEEEHRQRRAAEEELARRPPVTGRQGRETGNGG